MTGVGRHGRIGRIVGTAGVLALTVAGCGGGSASPAAQPKPAGAAATSSSQGSAITKAAAVKATGGGDFCKAIAASISHPPAPADTDKAIADQVALIRKEEQQAVHLAPASIKSDVVLLLMASDKVWTALDKVHYDYAKLTPADMAALADPATVAAEHRLTAYMTNTCGITAGAPTTK